MYEEDEYWFTDDASDEYEYIDFDPRKGGGYTKLVRSVHASGMVTLFDLYPNMSSSGIASYEGPDNPRMQVNLFGGLTVRIDDKVVPDYKWTKNKAKLLFANLVIKCGREIGREALLSTLWPNMDKRRAINNLYVVWSAMRKAIADENGESPYVIAHGELYRIDSSMVWSDVQEFDTLTRKMLFDPLTQAEVDRLYMRIDQLYAGDLLSGLRCDQYLTRQRDRYKDTYVDVLLIASKKMIAAGNTHGGLWFARKAFEMGVGREDVYQSLMVAQMEAGQRTSAIETFFLCKKYMDQVLGLPLSRKTLELYQKLINGE